MERKVWWLLAKKKGNRATREPTKDELFWIFIGESRLSMQVINWFRYLDNLPPRLCGLYGNGEDSYAQQYRFCQKVFSEHYNKETLVLETEVERI